MIITRKLLPVAILSATLLSASASWAGDANSWSGAWSGKLGEAGAWPVAVTISQAKVVGFSEKGVPLQVSYSKITPTKVTFGDQAHYRMQLVRTGDATASITLHGRHGVETGFLRK